MSRAKKFLLLEEREPSLARALFSHASEEVRYSASVDNNIHVTDLFNLCPREYFLLRTYNLKRERVIAPGTRMTFEMGKSIENVIVGWLREMGIIGDEQVDLIDEKLGISGHCDVRLKSNRLVEIKAKDPAIFRMTKHQPLARDLFQCQTYLWLDKAQRMKLLTVTWGQERMPYRDQWIQYNIKVPEVIKKVVGSIREAEAGGNWPPRVCGSRQDARASLCPVADYCFSQPSERIKTIKESLGE